MKKAIFTILLAISFSHTAQAQTIINTANAIKRAASAPSGACVPGQTRIYNTALYICPTPPGTATWTTAGGGIATSDSPTLTGQWTFAAGTITTSKPISITQTWNAGGVTFNPFLINVTDTASANASLLADFQVGGSSKFKISKLGTTTQAAIVATSPATGTAAGIFQAASGESASATVLSVKDGAGAENAKVTSSGFLRFGSPNDGTLSVTNFANVGLGTYAGGVVLGNAGSGFLYSTPTEVKLPGRNPIGWVGSGWSGSLETQLRSVSAANLAQGAADAASPVAQTLSVQSGSGTNIAGATWTQRASLGTGNAAPGALAIQGGARSATSGTTQQTAISREIIGNSITVANNTTTTITNGSWTLASNTVIGGKVTYTVEVFDGTELQVETGEVALMGINKGGVFSNNTALKYGNQQAVTSGTLTVTWSMTGATPSLLQVNVNSSLTPTTGYPRVTYTIVNNGQQAVQ